jgi:hypothetical protein
MCSIYKIYGNKMAPLIKQLKHLLPKNQTQYKLPEILSKLKKARGA